tara:strand:+ start:12124 stop:12288 length:165 start_codon:yes stop_codon:yes gene_type:complete
MSMHMMVSSEMGAVEFNALLEMGIDVMRHVISVEKSATMMEVVICIGSLDRYVI